MGGREVETGLPLEAHLKPTASDQLVVSSPPPTALLSGFG